ncbi:MAG: hypothetical protein RLY31_992 [Bacteroidota bacterium]|jgi:hypothetical protein
MALRKDFPKAGTSYLGGDSDGYVYRSVFAGASRAHSLEMIRQFLSEEGYGDVPLPADLEELNHFRVSVRNKQLLLFEDNGYVHNPVKILFPPDNRQKRALVLEIYDERGEKHLLRFHRKI